MKHFIEDLREKLVIKIPITTFFNDFFFPQTEVKNIESKEQSVESGLCFQTSWFVSSR